mmetsp:Transcript_2272/g.3607  ORF Transcript_2272/g.3607 Transcript_2272/m.3607 type:complete len:426 (-) Transcript_2272:1724-3001(-)|eukprot:CAMPEP_0197316980 /NCGR_PEP_ID=MMETSP0891-20130614/45100_1 /TAXON_ID=44058 ORGANISM="Aureoumbra lagunensis, Strain CCMP1510" /NCGR_SAMPLE_ID=MMETSP0891 /ASSEMBLY_ACC=CAM_ASM_000534 /LENGTH=425 /DNA_ID=CAMNT_0042806735 /DNA_START=56 /DNA_END=1333 /DNA_ORIENTATION=+
MTSVEGEEKVNFKGDPPREYPKKPTMTKAERRALQEKQRAAKAAARDETDQKEPQQIKAKATPRQEKSICQKKAIESDNDKNISRVASHLLNQHTSHHHHTKKEPMHWAIIKLGLQYAAGTIDGSNERCIAMLVAIKQMALDYQCPSDAVVSRDLDKKLKQAVQHLIESRPHAISMGAAVRQLRAIVARLPPETTQTEARRELCDAVDAFAQERIILPGQVIGRTGAAKIRNNDLVAVFGGGASTDAIEAILFSATEHCRFSVILIDTAPYFHGRTLLSKLHHFGIPTTYVHLRAAHFALAKGVHSLFIAADAVYANGSALADAGAAALAMTAKYHCVPVLVCCESYKFHAATHLDSLGWNEVITNETILIPKRTLFLRFDVTPATYITAFITEHGLIPPTSSAVLVRELELGQHAAGGIVGGNK